MSNTLNFLLSSNFWLKGKIIILNALALPKLQYITSIMSIANDFVQNTEKH